MPFYGVKFLEAEQKQSYARKVKACTLYLTLYVREDKGQITHLSVLPTKFSQHMKREKGLHLEINCFVFFCCQTIFCRFIPLCISACINIAITCVLLQKK